MCTKSWKQSLQIMFAISINNYVRCSWNIKNLFFSLCLFALFSAIIGAARKQVSRVEWFNLFSTIYTIYDYQRTQNFRLILAMVNFWSFSLVLARQKLFHLDHFQAMIMMKCACANPWANTSEWNLKFEIWVWCACVHSCRGCCARTSAKKLSFDRQQAQKKKQHSIA